MFDDLERSVFQAKKKESVLFKELKKSRPKKKAKKKRKKGKSSKPALRRIWRRII